MSDVRVHLPLGPIEAELRRRNWTAVEAFGLGTPLLRNWSRSKRRGYVTVAAADLICTKVFGRHPATLYGDAFWEGAW